MVTVDSTLGYEALSIGKKVLFGWGVNSVLGTQGESMVENLPHQICLENDKYEEARKKIGWLKNSSENEYLELIKGCQLFYVDQDVEYPPHERIRDEIRNYVAIVAK